MNSVPLSSGRELDTNHHLRIYVTTIWFTLQNTLYPRAGGKVTIRMN